MDLRYNMRFHLSYPHLAVALGFCYGLLLVRGLAILPAAAGWNDGIAQTLNFTASHTYRVPSPE